MMTRDDVAAYLAAWDRDQAEYRALSVIDKYAMTAQQQRRFDTLALALHTRRDHAPRLLREVVAAWKSEQERERVEG